MSRIQGCFEVLAKARRKALIPYITAGDPHPSLTVPLMRALVESGADILELGVPFSDPMADGPVIQRAGERALKYGVGLTWVLKMVEDFRRGDAATPVVLMGYANPVEAMGKENFIGAAKIAGVDGVIVVDYPPEECGPFADLCGKAGIDCIFLLAPTSTDARIREVAPGRHVAGLRRAHLEQARELRGSSARHAGSTCARPVAGTVPTPARVTRCSTIAPATSSPVAVWSPSHPGMPLTSRTNTSPSRDGSRSTPA